MENAIAEGFLEEEAAEAKTNTSTKEGSTVLLRAGGTACALSCTRLHSPLRGSSPGSLPSVRGGGRHSRCPQSSLSGNGQLVIGPQRPCPVLQGPSSRRAAPLPSLPAALE